MYIANTFDWVTKEEQTTNSEYLEDSLRFLDSTFKVLKILPVSTCIC